VSIERIFAVLLAGLLGFGGFGSLPGLRGQPAGAGMQTDLHPAAVSNISPGPNGLYLVAVGYFVGGTAAGLLLG
jgi:hypothetical protein